MQWEPSLAGLDDDEAEVLGIWLSNDLKGKEELFQENKESEVDNLNHGIEEWCNAATAASRKKNKNAEQEEEN